MTGILPLDSRSINLLEIPFRLLKESCFSWTGKRTIVRRGVGIRGKDRPDHRPSLCLFYHTIFIILQMSRGAEYGVSGSSTDPFYSFLRLIDAPIQRTSFFSPSQFHVLPLLAGNTAYFAHAGPSPRCLFPTTLPCTLKLLSCSNVGLLLTRIDSFWDRSHPPV